MHTFMETVRKVQEICKLKWRLTRVNKKRQIEGGALGVEAHCSPKCYIASGSNSTCENVSKAYMDNEKK